MRLNKLNPKNLSPKTRRRLAVGVAAALGAGVIAADSVLAYRNNKFKVARTIEREIRQKASGSYLESKLQIKKVSMPLYFTDALTLDQRVFLYHLAETNVPALKNGIRTLQRGIITNGVWRAINEIPPGNRSVLINDVEIARANLALMKEVFSAPQTNFTAHCVANLKRFELYSKALKVIEKKGNLTIEERMRFGLQELGGLSRDLAIKEQEKIAVPIAFWRSAKEEAPRLYNLRDALEKDTNSIPIVKYFMTLTRPLGSEFRSTFRLK